MAYFEQLLRKLPSVNYIADVVERDGALQFVPVFASPGLETMYGVPLSEVLGDDQWWTNGLHPDDRQRVLDSVPALFRDGQVVNVYRFRVRDGEYVHVRDTVALQRGEDGEPIRIIGSWADITAFRAPIADLDRDRARFRAEMLRPFRRESVAGLTAGLAHDLRNTFTSVGSYASLIASLSGDEAVRGYAAKIATVVESATAALPDLLAYGGIQELRTRTVVLDLIVEDALETLVPRLGSGVQLAVDVPSTLPGVRFDEVQLGEILSELVTNASDAMEGTGSIRVRAHRPGLEEVVLEVEDDGPGLTPEEQARVFEPFYSTKTRQPGRGLGLSRVLGTVEQSGGRVEIESEPGRGTAVRLFLRVAKPGAASVSPTRRAILVVDDDPDVLESTCALMRHMGYEAHPAPDADTALELLAGNAEFAVLCTDVSLPGMDGVSLAHEALRHSPELSVILMSGYLADAGNPDLPRILLEKPFTAEELRAVLEQALAGERLRGVGA